MSNPKVTVFIPVYNEERHIETVLEGLLHQEWPDPMEILFVDGNSSDRTVEVIQRTARNAPPGLTVRVLHNPERHIPVSLNIACREATGDILVRLDGHTYPPAHFVSRILTSLKSIDCRGTVGGCWNIVPADQTVRARACAAAVRHRFGIGNAAYRTLKPGPVAALQPADTVPFGAFRKSLWGSLGGYDETLLFDEDSDFNFRVRKAGYGVWLDPGIVFDYVARPNLKQLSVQYFRYGFWAARFFWKHRTISSWRKLAPITFTAAVLFFSLTLPAAGAGLFALHLAAATLFAFRETLRQNEGLKFLIYLTAAFWILHWSYGIGNWCGLLTGFGTRRKAHVNKIEAHGRAVSQLKRSN